MMELAEEPVLSLSLSLCLSLSAMSGHSQKADSASQEASMSLPGDQIHQHLDLGLLVSRTTRIPLLKPPHLIFCYGNQA